MGGQVPRNNGRAKKKGRCDIFGHCAWAKPLRRSCGRKGGWGKTGIWLAPALLHTRFSSRRSNGSRDWMFGLRQGTSTTGNACLLSVSFPGAGAKDGPAIASSRFSFIGHSFSNFFLLFLGPATTRDTETETAAMSSPERRRPFHPLDGLWRATFVQPPRSLPCLLTPIPAAIPTRRLNRQISMTDSPNSAKNPRACLAKLRTGDLTEAPKPVVQP